VEYAEAAREFAKTMRELEGLIRMLRRAGVGVGTSRPAPVSSSEPPTIGHESLSRHLPPAVNRIVTYGESAGGHLALTSAMIPESEGLDRQCTANAPVPKVAAVFNFYGITDVADVIDGPHKANLAVTWLGSRADRMEVARRVSPLTYVRPGLPPVLTVHGDEDPTVPYEEAVRLQKALSKAGVPNQLLTIPGDGHGQFQPDERTKIFATIREFLAQHGLPATNP
jgi:acetyl esterase/lipase